MIKKIITMTLISSLSFAYEIENAKYAYIKNLYSSLIKIEQKIDDSKISNLNVAKNTNLEIPRIYHHLFDKAKKEEITRLLIDLYELKLQNKIEYENFNKFNKEFWDYIQILKTRN